MNIRVAEAESRIGAAVAREADASTAIIRHNRWSLAVDAVIEHPEWIDVTGTMIQLDRHAAATTRVIPGGIDEDDDLVELTFAPDPAASVFENRSPSDTALTGLAED